MPDELTADDFRPHLGATFQLTPAEGGEPIASELTEVEEHPSPDAPRQPFVLLFRATADAPIEQGLHRVEREGGEAHEIFLVPVGPDLLEAVFA